MNLATNIKSFLKMLCVNCGILSITIKLIKLIHKIRKQISKFYIGAKNISAVPQALRGCSADAVENLTSNPYGDALPFESDDDVPASSTPLSYCLQLHVCKMWIVTKKKRKHKKKHSSGSFRLLR